MVVDDLSHAFQRAEEEIFIHIGVHTGVGLRELQELNVWGEKIRHIGDPRCILLNGRIGDFELLFKRVKCNANTNRFVVLVQNLTTKQCCHEGGDALLSVNQDALSGRQRAVLKTNSWVAPRD